MNLISLQQATMTSLDIADLVDSRHDNVRVSIERLVERGVIQLPPMQEVENKQATSPNSKSKVYVFSGEQGKRDSIVVVAQLSPEFTARLVDRWQELEKATGTYQIPQTYPEALRAYADELEAHEKTKQALEAAKPKAEYFDNLVSRNLLVNIRDAAKELRVKQNEFVNFLLGNGYLYRDQKGKLRPYAQHTPALFEVKEFTRGEYSDVQTLVTPTGRETFRLLLQVPTLENK